MRKRIVTGSFLCLAMIFGASCSTFNKIALNSTSGILEEGADQVNYESDWVFFKEAAPANIKMIEGMSHADPENRVLLGMLVKAYGGYAYGVRETQYLDDYFGDTSSNFFKERAISAYSKALDYGLKYLELKGIQKEAIFSKDAARKLPASFNEKLGEEDMTAVFYTAQSLGGLINLQKNNVHLLSRVGAVKAMMDWVCEKDKEFERGACYLFYAMYESARPAMLGGDLEKGKSIFKTYMEKYPHNLLGRVSYIQFYVIPMMDEIEYASQREFLIKEFKKWKSLSNAGEAVPGSEAYKRQAYFNLYNAIAYERFKIIEKHKEDIF